MFLSTSRSPLAPPGTRTLAAVLIALTCGACQSDQKRFDAWPLYYHEERGKSKETDILWPLVESVQGPEKSAEGVYPFVTSFKQPEHNSKSLEVLYPIFIDRQGDTRHKIWVLPLFYYTKQKLPVPFSKTTVFPLLWWGSDKKGQGYFAFFPFYGTIRERLAREEIFFVLFPIYERSLINGHVANNVLFPLIAWTHGGRTESSRVIPFYTHRKTDGFPDEWSVLWPIIHFTKSTGDEPNPRNMFAIWPLFGWDNTPKRHTWMILWPFFTFAKEEGTDYYSWLGPWPILRLEKTKDLSRTQVWPFYGYLNRKGSVKRYWMWPVYRTYHQETEKLAQRDWSVLLVLVHKEFTDKLQNTQEVRTGFWPLFRYYRKSDGTKWFYALAPLWIHDEPGFERVYSRFWRLFEYIDNKKNDETSYRFLWRLVRYDRYKDYKTFNVIGPLFRYESQPEVQTKYSVLGGLFTVGSRGGAPVLKILYVPLLSGKEPARTRDKVIDLGDAP